MPIYEYQCETGHVFEVLQGVGDAEIGRCRYCRAKAHRILSPANFVLKGPGFYVNDYKKKTQSTESSSGGDQAKKETQKKDSKDTGEKS